LLLKLDNLLLQLLFLSLRAKQLAPQLVQNIASLLVPNSSLYLDYIQLFSALHGSWKTSLFITRLPIQVHLIGHKLAMRKAFFVLTNRAEKIDL
jgi:hypothetical protein